MTIIAKAIASASARDYDWLKASIAGWMHRTDLELFIPDMVMLAEKRINGDLKARLAENITVLSVPAGAATIDLPPDFAEMRKLSIPGQKPLTYAAPALLEQRGDSRPRAPHSYTIVGRVLLLQPNPERAYTIDMVYRGGVPALADSPGGVNWLIEQHPDVYLAAAMCEAHTYARNTVEQQKWEGKYAIATSLLNNYNEWENAGSLALPAPT